MAYSLVPDANNTVGSDLTAMYDNFVALESAQIVDSGSTADGDYWRFEDGLQVCVLEGSLFYYDENELHFTWSYPSSFANVLFESCFPDDGMTGATPRYRETNNIFKHMGVFKMLGQSTSYQSGDQISALFIAIGRWK